MASLRDVARAAGVSTATVARVLRDSPQVSEALRRRVQDAVDALNYVPNAVARSLSQGRTNLLGLVVPDIANPFFAAIARGLEDYAAAHGRHVLVASSDVAAEREHQLISAFESRTVDAVALAPGAGGSEHVRRLVAGGTPIVFVDRRLADVDAPAVLTNNAESASRAVRHLIDLGHRDIGFVGGPARYSTAVERMMGFREACREAGLRVRPVCIREGFDGVDGGQQAVRELLDLPQRPTAVFCGNHLLAIGALGALREAEVRVPDDLSLLAFGDLMLFPYVDPPITAVAQPAYEMGEAAGQLLIDMLQRPDRLRRQDVVLHTDFRVRASCGPPPVGRRSKRG